MIIFRFSRCFKCVLMVSRWCFGSINDYKHGIWSLNRLQDGFLELLWTWKNIWMVLILRTRRFWGRITFLVSNEENVGIVIWIIYYIGVFKTKLIHLLFINQNLLNCRINPNIQKSLYALVLYKNCSNETESEQFDLYKFNIQI